jgi:hypothetical protein
MTTAEIDNGKGAGVLSAIAGEKEIGLESMNKEDINENIEYV